MATTHFLTVRPKTFRWIPALICAGTLLCAAPSMAQQPYPGAGSTPAPSSAPGPSPDNGQPSDNNGNNGPQNAPSDNGSYNNAPSDNGNGPSQNGDNGRRTYSDNGTSQRTLPAGTLIKVKLLQNISSKVSQTGDKIHAQVAPDDRSGLPNDVTFTGRLTDVEPADKDNVGRIALRFGTITRDGHWQNVAAEPADEGTASASYNGKKDQKSVLGYAAGGGALLGVLRKGKVGDALEGGLIGALGGAAYDAYQKSRSHGGDVELKKGQELTIRLDRPLAVRSEVGAY